MARRAVVESQFNFCFAPDKEVLIVCMKEESNEEHGETLVAKADAFASSRPDSLSGLDWLPPKIAVE